MNIPVYLFTGFLESGKTTFIKEILKDEQFIGDECSVLFLCEEGIEEFEEEELKRTHTIVVPVDNEEDFTTEFIKKHVKDNKAGRVFIEFNGMWDFENFYDSVLP